MPAEEFTILSLLAALILAAITVRWWYPQPYDERSELPPGWIGFPSEYIGRHREQFEFGFIAGAWVVFDRTGDRMIKLVWSRFEADVNLGTAQERAYALGWMAAVRPTWEAAMEFDLPAGRNRLISGAVNIHGD